MLPLRSYMIILMKDAWEFIWKSLWMIIENLYEAPSKWSLSGGITILVNNDPYQLVSVTIFVSTVYLLRNGMAMMYQVVQLFNIYKMQVRYNALALWIFKVVLLASYRVRWMWTNFKMFVFIISKMQVHYNALLL